ncbi:MAG: hypothetical protein HEP71_24755 [Roseivirga sp.]|nr:hypothetical protein [Roseivirga sp.]
MIKFFRKIRQNLLSEGKTGKYLKYAIGEIVLVVIGILIALQANNWNEQRKLDNRIEKFFPKLKHQLEGNISIVIEDLETIEYFYERSQSIANNNIGNKDKIDLNKIDSLILFTGTDFHLNLNMITVNEAQLNENLANIKSDTLRESIYLLIKTNELIIEREQIVNEDVTANLKPFLNKHYNLKNLFNSLGYSGFEHSNIDSDDIIKIMHNQEFENLIVTRVLYLEDLAILYYDLKQELETVYQLLEKEMQEL